MWIMETRNMCHQIGKLCILAINFAFALNKYRQVIVTDVHLQTSDLLT